MAKYRMKPTIVEAWQVSKDNWQELERMAPNFISFVGNRVGDGPNDLDCLGLSISTPEEKEFANLGDWIVRTAEERFYSCSPDSFEDIYELVEP